MSDVKASFWYRESTSEWVLEINLKGDEVSGIIRVPGHTKDEAIKNAFNRGQELAVNTLRDMAGRIRRHEIHPYTNIENMLEGEADLIEREME